MTKYRNVAVASKGILLPLLATEAGTMLPAMIDIQVMKPSFSVSLGGSSAGGFRVHVVPFPFRSFIELISARNLSRLSITMLHCKDSSADQIVVPTETS